MSNYTEFVESLANIFCDFCMKPPFTYVFASILLGFSFDSISILIGRRSL